MADSALGKSIKESGPQSPGSMYEALKYIIQGPGGGDSPHLKRAADNIEEHHKSVDAASGSAASDLGLGK